MHKATRYTVVENFVGVVAHSSLLVLQSLSGFLVLHQPHRKVARAPKQSLDRRRKGDLRN